jgi:hypothetical protein
MTSEPGSANPMTVAAIASMAPTVTSTSVSGLYSMPKVAAALRGDRLAQGDAHARRVLIDPFGDRVLRGLEHRRRAVLIGKPWPRLTAPIRAASADISANTVTVRLEPRHRHSGRAWADDDAPRDEV